MFWNPILSKITPSFLERCAWAIKDSNEFLEKTLRVNMLGDMSEREQSDCIDRIKDVFANNAGRAHNTHIGIDKCIESGLKIIKLEEDQKLQDLVLTLHHCYMHTLSNTPAFKVVENQLGRAIVRQNVMQIVSGQMIAPPTAVQPVPDAGPITDPADEG
jgi:hypothetical protein